MITDEDVPRVHSVAEAYLYLMLSPCERCGKGPLKQYNGLTKTSSAPGGWTLATRCANCSSESSLHFAIEPEPTRAQAKSDQINPTPHRSQAIDLLGWLSLFQSILTESQRQKDRRAARHLAYEAAQCLDEAIKFYNGDEELPDEEAFYSETSRRRFRDHPEQFARSKWRQRRLTLPDVHAKTQPLHGPPRRPWWRFWR